MPAFELFLIDPAEETNKSFLTRAPKIVVHENVGSRIEKMLETKSHKYPRTTCENYLMWLCNITILGGAYI